MLEAVLLSKGFWIKHRRWTLPNYCSDRPGCQGMFMPLLPVGCVYAGYSGFISNDGMGKADGIWQFAVWSSSSAIQ